MTEVKNHIMFSEMKEINVSFVSYIFMLSVFLSELWWSFGICLVVDFFKIWFSGV